MSRATSKQVGKDVQHRVIECIDALEPVEAILDEWGNHHDDYWHDTVTRTALYPRPDLPMVGLCVVDPYVPVEIKAAAETITSGSEPRRGRFYIRRSQHERLAQEGGIYIFALYTESKNPALKSLLVCPAVCLEDVRSTWYPLEERDDYWQLISAKLPLNTSIRVLGSSGPEYIVTFLPEW